MQRNGHTQNGSPLAMDNLNYNYTAGTNKLRQVTDAVPDGNYTEDIDNQTDTDNYVYDAIGNLINDKAEKINKINWTVYGKIGNIQKHNAFIGYGYDASGNRVVKQYNKFTTNLCADCPPGSATDNLVVYERKNNQPTTYTARTSITFEEGYIDGTNDEYEAEINDALAVCTPDCNQAPPLLNSNVDIYIRDAQGNVMAVYSYAPAVGSTAASFKWTEQHLYGSSRIGIFKWDSIVPLQPPVVLSSNAIVTDIYKTGSKFFELTNHLQNVLVTYSDKKVQVANGSNVDYFLADVISASDYFVFGGQMNGRKFSSSAYRYGFNSHEKSDEIVGEGNHTTALFGEYDTRLGRRWNVDPKPNISFSVYSVFNNSPISISDLLLDTSITSITKLNYDKIENNFNRDGQSILREKESLNYLAGKKKPTNTCAIKVSDALIKAGYDIPQSQDLPSNVRVQNGTGKENDKGNHILDAESFANYLLGIEKPTYSFTNLTTDDKIEAAIKKIHESDDMRGIIAIVAGDKKKYEGTGHVDLLYEDFMWDLSMYGYGSGKDLKSYLQDDQNKKSKLKIYIWVIKKD